MGGDATRAGLLAAAGEGLERCAHFGADRPGHVVVAFFVGVENARQQIEAILPRGGREGRKRRPRRRHRAIHVGRRAHCDGTHGGFGGRIDHVTTRRAGRLDPLAVDIELLLVHGVPPSLLSLGDTLQEMLCNTKDGTQGAVARAVQIREKSAPQHDRVAGRSVGGHDAANVFQGIG